MIDDLQFAYNRPARRFTQTSGLFWVIHGSTSGIAYLGNFTAWKRLRRREQMDGVIKEVGNGLSHEELHQVLAHTVNPWTSAKLDTLCGHWGWDIDQCGLSSRLLVRLTELGMPPNFKWEALRY